jgi:hypothetical protein
MSIRQIARVFALPPTVRVAERMVLTVLANYADDNGGHAWPSWATIARSSGLTKRAVYAILLRLGDQGLITVEAPARQHRTPRYRVNLPDARGEPGSPLSAQGCTSFTSDSIPKAPEVKPLHPIRQ